MMTSLIVHLHFAQIIDDFSCQKYQTILTDYERRLSPHEKISDNFIFYRLGNISNEC